MAIKVAIVESDERIRNSLAELVDSADICCCVGRCPTGESALSGLTMSRPDVVVMDINLPGMDGVSCVRRLKEKLPNTQFVMLTEYDNESIIFNALTAGANGYLLKQTSPEKLIEAIREIYEGGSPISGHIARKIVRLFQQTPKPVHELEKLSVREQQVLQLLAEGFFYREIANKLSISYCTAHTHVRHIYKKLHVRSRARAVSKYFQQVNGKVLA